MCTMNPELTSGQRLMAESQHMGVEVKVAADKLDRLEEENAKLRELVQLMVNRHTPISPCKNVPCGECPVKDECDQEDALMRELGIEVDE